MAADAKTHGMDGALVAPDWPALTLDEVRGVLEHYPGCNEPLTILSVSPRPFSAASVVATRSGRVFVKRHAHAVRDAEGLREEHRFLEHLWTQGAAVPRVLATSAGQTVVEDAEWTYEVHETPEGMDIYEDAISWTPFRSAQHAKAAGRALARLHLAARGYAAPVRKPRPLVASFSIFASENPDRALDNYLSARPVLREHAETRQLAHEALELLAPYHAELAPLMGLLTPLWTHNDLHASNLFWTENSDRASVSTVIDFGLADRTNAVHDIAHAIERNMIEWLTLVKDPARPDGVAIHLDHLCALLDGYDQVRPLTKEEAAALAPMTALCHAEFALTEADYFLGVLHSEEKARMASDGYLVGHARWFRSSAGRRLLDRIRQWAYQRQHGAREAARA
jgi:Ser/Thr protein kinase RdoA (MazF antagonist)